MTTRIPSVPPACEVVGQIYNTTDTTLLTQDMLEVFCPETSTLIRAGWIPDEDPSGSYFVAAYRDCRRIRTTYRSDRISEVTSLVERLAIEYSHRFVSDELTVVDAVETARPKRPRAAMKTNSQPTFFLEIVNA